jgi:flavin reductase (DIM6/NTAB) family NADH-FMN oxidoreductase RutF
VLDGALAALECQTFAVYDAGDHSIIVGRVTAVENPADPPARGAAPAHGAAPARSAAPAPPARGAAPAPPARGPLVHHAGRYHRLRPTED